MQAASFSCRKTARRNGIEGLASGVELRNLDSSRAALGSSDDIRSTSQGLLINTLGLQDLSSIASSGLQHGELLLLLRAEEINREFVQLPFQLLKGI